MKSSFRTETITLPVILRKTSLTTIGPNPGFLSNGIKQQDRKASTEFQKEQYTIFGQHLQIPYGDHYLLSKNYWEQKFNASHWHPYLMDVNIL